MTSAAGCRTATHPSATATTPQPHRRGGPTSALNGLGICEACNYTKEAAGWTVATGFTENGRHTAEFTTPTGAHYQSVAPPAPGTAATEPGEVEARVA